MRIIVEKPSEKVMKKPLRSDATTQGRRMAGARALWRANGMKEEQIGKPIIAIVNSFTQFVPGHTHLHEIGQTIKEEIENSGCFAAEFNTIAIDDGIAMGHDGMLYSLPSRELIADIVEYMMNAHQADAMVCISNCDKVTPGMLLAAMRLNVPTVFVSGGPMEAGKVGERNVDLVNIMVDAADGDVPDETVLELERKGCPTCGCCSGMFTANSMNSLTEALGLSLPGNGTLLSTHKNRLKLFKKAARQIVENTTAYYRDGDESVLPRNIANREAMLNAMSLDIAMGGSTNTVLHLLAIAHEAGIDFSLDDINRLSLQTPVLCKVAPNSAYHIQDVNRAGGIISILQELSKKNLLRMDVKRVDGLTLKEAIEKWGLGENGFSPEADELWRSAPGGEINNKAFHQDKMYETTNTDREKGCIRNFENSYLKDGGIAVLKGNIAKDGCVVKTAGVDESILKFTGPAKIFDSQESAVEGILGGKVSAGDVVVITYEGPKGGPGMQEMLYPTSYLKSRHLGKACALITDGRFSGGTSGLSIGHISPEAAAGGEIALLRDGDIIDIDIPNRSINARINDEEFAKRRKEEETMGKEAFTPRGRKRNVSNALKAYASLVLSADKGGVRKQL